MIITGVPPIEYSEMLEGGVDPQSRLHVFKYALYLFPLWDALWRV